MIQQGAQAPDFTASVWNGDALTLSSLRGRKVWLAFFRYASCPLCNLRVHEMTGHNERWEAEGLQVLAVFQSPPDKIAKYVGSQRPPFPLLCDPDEDLYALYGLSRGIGGMMRPSLSVKLAKAATRGFLPGMPDGTVSRLPADFLIDEEGIVSDVFAGGDIGEHIPFERVERFLEPRGESPQ